jgi:hypothetical protein
MQKVTDGFKPLVEILIIIIQGRRKLDVILS